MLLRLTKTKLYDSDSNVMYSIVNKYERVGYFEYDKTIYFRVERLGDNPILLYEEKLGSGEIDGETVLLDWLEEKYRRGDKVIDIGNVVWIYLDKVSYDGV